MLFSWHTLLKDSQLHSGSFSLNSNQHQKVVDSDETLLVVDVHIQLSGHNEELVRYSRLSLGNRSHGRRLCVKEKGYKLKLFSIDRFQIAISENDRFPFGGHPFDN